MVFYRFVLIGAVLCLSAQAEYQTFEGKQTSPIRISPGGTRLLAVNTPDARLSVFDISRPDNPILVSEIPVGLEPVSVNPRTDDECWVVNELSDSVSIVSLPDGNVIDTVQVKDEPADVVFALGKAFVSAARRNELHVFDATNRASLGVIPLVGENPRALTVGSETNVYVVFNLGGNGTTIIPENVAPPQPAPNVITNTPPSVAMIVHADDPAWTNVITYTMPDHDVAEVNADTLAVNRYFSHVGTVNFGIAIDPAGDALYVANTEARNTVALEPNVRGHAVDNRLTRITLSGSVTPFDLNPGIDYNTLPNPSALSNALSQPTDVCFAPDGTQLFVAAFGTDRIARTDTNGTVLSIIEIGDAPGTNISPRTKRGPRALAHHPTTNILYVMNRLANTITVLDTASETILREIPAGSHDPTPDYVREGRGFLYDAKLSGNGTMSCASCHVDGEMDMLAWDLGDPDGQMTIVTQSALGLTIVMQLHPMKGPMVTQTLRGLDTLEPFHWRGDRADFTKFNVAFDGLLGGSQISSNDMDTFLAFINSIGFHPNPNLNLDRSLPATHDGGDPVAGANTFTNEAYVTLPFPFNLPLSCATCHTEPPGPGSNNTIIPGVIMGTPQDFKVPHLRNVYKKLNVDFTNGATSVGGFGIVHDGIDPDLFTFLSRPVFGTFSTDATRKRNLNAFVQCFDTGTAPAVGHQQTATPETLLDPDTSNTWSTLEQQAAISNADLVVRGTVAGHRRSFLYDATNNLYLSDASGVGPYTRGQLLSLVGSNDFLTALGVGHGNGHRLALDRNDNGILDGDEPQPYLDATAGPDALVVSWPTNEAFQVLEFTADLSSSDWTTVLADRNGSGDSVVVTNDTAAPSSVFRLRRPW